LYWRAPNELIERILSGMTGTPAYVRNAKMEVESTRWARHNVHFHRTARKTLRNALAGEIELAGFLASWTAAHASPHGAELRSGEPLT
jgi:hypothetical protein